MKLFTVLISFFPVLIFAQGLAATAQSSKSGGSFFTEVVFGGGFCLINYGDKPQAESFEVLRKDFMEKIKRDKKIRGEYTKVFYSPFIKCMGSEHPLEKGSFINKMYYDKFLNNTCVSFIIEYTKNKKNPHVKQQELVTFLLRNMAPHRTSKSWYKITPDIILSCFSNPDYYNNEARKIIKNYLLKEGEGRASFLIDLAGLYNDPEIQEYLHNKASKCEEWQWKKNTEWVALLILAHHGEKDAIKKIIEIAQKPTKNRSRQVFDMPLQLAYVPQPQIVELLKSFLTNKESYFFGADVFPQYFRLCHTSAISLSILLEGFPNVDPNYFKESDREKWLDWFKDNKQWKIKKEIVYPSIIKERLY
jgi:hypothetical protein